MKLLRKADILLILFMALIPAFMLAYNTVSAMKYSGPRLVILRDGEIYGTYPLTEECTIEIGDTNICEIQGGKVRMIHADCPDQVCVHSAPIGRFGGSIVCLPNKIVLRIEDAEENTSSDAPDAVAR